MYANASKLFGLLKVAKVRNNLEAELKKIERCQLLILDDLFLVPLDAKERPILLDIIEDRHERKSIIITSQYPSSSWYDMVGDPTVGSILFCPRGQITRVRGGQLRAPFPVREGRIF